MKLTVRLELPAWSDIVAGLHGCGLDELADQVAAQVTATQPRPHPPAVSGPLVSRATMAQCPTCGQSTPSLDGRLLEHLAGYERKRCSGSGGKPW